MIGMLCLICEQKGKIDKLTEVVNLIPYEIKLQV